MIRLSKLADYGFILLIQILESEKGAMSAAELAEDTGLPQPTVAKIMKLLAKADLVSSQRGAMGGYAIKKSPKNISIADVIEAMDGPIALTSCVKKTKGKPGCIGAPFCSLHGHWDKINRATKEALASVSLSDLSSRG